MSERKKSVTLINNSGKKKKYWKIITECLRFTLVGDVMQVLVVFTEKMYYVSAVKL